MRDLLLGYYERELIFLRRMGADFARKYPKVAARLSLEQEKVEDPHVERMIEAFAFLSARVNLKLDDELPEITESFLNILYPHYLAPIPSMAIAQLSFGNVKDKLATAQVVERGTRLNTRPVDGSPCQFRTTSEINLLPLELESAALESPAPKDSRGRFANSHIRLSLKAFGDGNLHEIKLANTQESPGFVRFYLDGDPQIVFPLYEIIMNHSTTVEFKAVNEQGSVDNLKTLINVQLKGPDPVTLSAAEAIKQVGFDENEAILPYTKRSFAGYRLLSEYFAFPYKFLFFDVHGLDQAAAKKFGNRFDILIHLKDITPPVAPITEDNFKLGCTPMVNLFSRLADPTYLSQQRYEYQIFPDVHRQTTTEIYSIDEVFSSDPVTGVTREFSPFYSLRHAFGDEMEKTFWYGVRRQSERPEDDGTEMFLSFVDSSFDPSAPAVEVLNARVTCTNRDLPGKLPFGGKDNDLEIEGSALVSSARCLTKPTETIRPPQRRSAQWRLISHLNLNYISLVANENKTPEALQEILHLYNFNDSSVTRKQILGLVGIETSKVVRQIGGRIGTGFVRGFETTLTFDEEQFVGSSLYLFACVLDRFLGLYSSVNSFSRLVIRSLQKEETIKAFAPRAGEQELA